MPKSEPDDPEVAAIITGLALPVLIKLAPILKLMDYTNDRKVHTNPTPCVGGLAMLIGLGSLFFFMDKPDINWVPILTANLIILITGLVDDRTHVRAWNKLAIQFAAAFILVMGTSLQLSTRIPWLHFINHPAIATVFACIWIVGITNAINLVDGMDGLAGGISFFSLGALVFVAYQKQLFTSSMVSAAFMGSVISFLLYNLPKARTFMGDHGSLLLGFNIGVLSISASMKTGTAFAILVPILFVALPVFDTLLAIFRRLKNGQNPITTPDKEHFHHRLLALKFSNKQILIAFYLVAFTLSIVATSAGDIGILRALTFVSLLLYGFFAISYVMKRQQFDNKIVLFNKKVERLQEKIKSMGAFRNDLDRFLVRLMMKVLILLLLVAFFPKQEIPYKLVLVGSLIIAFYIVAQISNKLREERTFASGLAFFWMYFFLFHTVYTTPASPLLLVGVLAIGSPLLLYAILVKRYLNIFFPEPTEVMSAFILYILYKINVIETQALLVCIGLSAIAYLLHKGIHKNNIEVTQEFQIIHILIACMIPVYWFWNL